MKELYTEKILELAKSEQNFQELKSATHVFTAYNPLCGDKFTFYIRVEATIISEATFNGFGCALSRASSAVLVSVLKGKSLDGIPSIINEFFLSLQPQSNVDKIEYMPFRPVLDYPERRSCIILGWEELDNQVKSNKLV